MESPTIERKVTLAFPPREWRRLRALAAASDLAVDRAAKILSFDSLALLVGDPPTIGTRNDRAD